MKGKTNVLVTGVTGFVGKALLIKLLDSESHNISAAVRSKSAIDGCKTYTIGDFTGGINWSTALTNQEVVIHTAARTHHIKEQGTDHLADYRKVNVDATLNLAHQAAEAGVKRFIFISSVKVNGERTLLGKPFCGDDMPVPQDAYGISKWEAEKGLQQLASETDMEIVIIRPPLVYGVAAKGNFASMVKLVNIGLPLPLGAIHNKRSLVALDNLIDLITRCIHHPAAANQVFLVSDGDDLSTTDLLRGVACALGRPSRLIPVPASFLMLTASFLGKKDMAQKLFGSLQVDISKTRNLLNWEPPVSVEEGFKRCFE